jgi:two-component system chemotaxis sensor kinase CheA
MSRQSFAGVIRGAGLSLGTKLALATATVLVLVSSLVFYGLTTHARNTLLQSKSKAAALMTDMFAASAIAPLDFGDDKDVDNQLQSLRVNRDITYAAVWREAGDAPTATIGDATGGQKAAPTASATQLLPDCIELVRRIERPDGSLLGFVLLRFSLASEYAELRTQRRGILLGTAGTAALVGLLILGIARVQIVSPLERLVVAAHRVEAGDQTVRVEVGTRDEVGKLASAFNTMSAAIRDREDHLAEAMKRLRELFDHMKQGIVVFGRNGIVEAAPSRQAGQLFGPDVAGRRIFDLLYGDAPDGSPGRQAFELWLEHAFEVAPECWGELAELAPPEVERRHGGEPQWLELQFIAIVQGESVERVMLLATDVTDRRKLERAAQTREEQHARQMGTMRRLVAGGGQVFATFLDGAQARFAACQEKLAEKALDSDALGLVFSHVHTIRGEARTFELPELAAECQGLERILRELREAPGPVAAAQRGELRVRLERATLAVEHARDLFVEAAPIGRAVLDQMTVRKSDVVSLTELLSGSGDPVRRLLSRLTSRPFGECISALESAAPRWAEQVGKQATVIIEGRDTRVPGNFAPLLAALLPHLVRNAIAHGIEGPDVRQRCGKPTVGVLRIAAREDADALRVSVRDDGAGLDDQLIRDRAKELGLSDAPPTELVFAMGLSTLERADELAGQGVGLSAVRDNLTRIGGRVTLSSQVGHGAELVITAPFALAS